MKKDLLTKLGQLQYEISLLGLSEEEVTGITVRTDELKDKINEIEDSETYELMSSLSVNSEDDDYSLGYGDQILMKENTLFYLLPLEDDVSLIEDFSKHLVKR